MTLRFLEQEVTEATEIRDEDVRESALARRRSPDLAATRSAKVS
jgi:hypothetical protein